MSKNTTLDNEFGRDITVVCRSEGNPDHGQYAPLSPDRVFGVTSIERAIDACRHYIRQYDLGGGNWTGGEVYESGEYLGRISYNGRFWPAGHEYA